MANEDRSTSADLRSTPADLRPTSADARPTVALPAGKAQAATTCPECKAPLERPVACRACGALLRPAPGLDHFQFFGLEAKYAIDDVLLEKAFLELSRLLHPDRQIARGDAASLPARRSRALALSAAMNAAYAILKEPLKRAEYLIKVLGGPGPEQDKRTPPGFLHEILEMREEAEEAKSQGKRDVLSRRLAQLDQLTKVTFERVRSSFARTPVDLASVRVELNALKYLLNLSEELRSALRV